MIIKVIIIKKCQNCLLTQTFRVYNPSFTILTLFDNNYFNYQLNLLQFWHFLIIITLIINLIFYYQVSRISRRLFKSICYEKHSLARKRNSDKAIFFLRKWRRKNSPAVRRRARLNQTQNWLVSRELLLNKPNKQDVYEIDSFNKFNFSQSQEILDTLIDDRNVKHQNTTS